MYRSYNPTFHFRSKSSAQHIMRSFQTDSKEKFAMLDNMELVLDNEDELPPTDDEASLK
jgi:hypothetical protein